MCWKEQITWKVYHGIYQVLLQCCKSNNKVIQLFSVSIQGTEAHKNSYQGLVENVFDISQLKLHKKLQTITSY